MTRFVIVLMAYCMEKDHFEVHFLDSECITNHDIVSLIITVHIKSNQKPLIS